MVKARLPKRISAAANDGNRIGGPRCERVPKQQTAHLLSRWAAVSPSGLMGGTTPEASALKIYLDLTLLLTVGGRGRTRAVLGHELVELFLVLGVT
jgi:hypothetical protein